MKILESVVSWAQSFGMGGAFFIITLAASAPCGMALWVVLTIIKCTKP